MASSCPVEIFTQVKAYIIGYYVYKWIWNSTVGEIANAVYRRRKRTPLLHVRCGNTTRGNMLHCRACAMEDFKTMPLLFEDGQLDPSKSNWP